jgi:hypothetical protein
MLLHVFLVISQVKKRWLMFFTSIKQKAQVKMGRAVSFPMMGNVYLNH